MNLNARSVFRVFRVVFLCVFALACVGYVVLRASGAEPEPRQVVTVCVRTDTTTNIGDGVYLGGGIVAVDKHVVQGSLGTRASGSAGSGTVVSEGRGRGVGLIKLDSLPAPPPKCERTTSFYRQMSYTRPTWLTDYIEAYTKAKRRSKMLLVYFQGDPSFERNTLTDPSVRKSLRDYVCVRVPMDAPVLKGPAMKEMKGYPGVVIVDMTESPLYGKVVSTFPITDKLNYTPKQMCVILNLPTGTLTQRTLVYAVRTHPEGPASTSGTFDPLLAKEAERHSLHQARIQLQGHHNWDRRFRRINAVLPSGLTACEVCAESWPGENLVEAAIECVRSWRASSGHWRAVRGACPVYGYDMKRGRNGIWYATGIFGQD